MDTSTEIAAVPIPLSAIRFGANNRETFPQEHIDSIAESFRVSGQRTPIVVRQLPGGEYELGSGECRSRAALSLAKRGATIKGLPSGMILAIVKPMSDLELLDEVLGENNARLDPNPMEQAKGIDRGIRARLAMGMGRDEAISDLCRKTGTKSRIVHNRLPLLSLVPDLQKLVSDGQLSPEYGRVLGQAGLDPNRQRLAVRELNANPAASVKWFAARCAELAAEQSQESMFDLDAFMRTVTYDETPIVKLPPDPRTTKPPVTGGTPLEVMRAQIDWYTDVASQWDRLGKPNKRDQAAAKAEALQQMITDLGLDLLDSNQAAAALGVDVKTIHYHVRAGKLHPARSDGGYRFSQDELDRFVAEGPRKPGPKPRK